MSRRWPRIFSTVGTLVVVCAAYAWFFGLQTVYVIETRWIARKNPISRMIPRPLPDSSLTSLPGTKLSYLGYDFEVPWSDLDETQTKIGPNNVVLKFRSGVGMRLASLPPREFVDGVSKQMDSEALRQIYGDGPLQSDYAFWSLINQATPDQVTLFTPRKKTVGTMMLLMIKEISAPERSGLYAVQSEGYKGFQWGDPKSARKRVITNLYADDGSVELMFFPLPKSGATISQPEINRVVQTLHRSASGATATGPAIASR